MTVPAQPKIYHIVHLDKLPAIVASGGLLCDAEMAQVANPQGTVIGMTTIKQRRLQGLTLTSHPGLYVGQCVPFYFCPRSIMLYLIYQANHPELAYKGGQGPIVHIEADLHATVAWAHQQNLRWAFTLSNAGARYFEDRADLARLCDLNWAAIGSTRWSGAGIDPSIKEGKQAEFLIERGFPWALVERIGVRSAQAYQQVMNALPANGHRPPVEVRPEWYY